MAITISYEKYEYMTKRQIFTALLNAEKKFEKIKAELENQKNLVNFLKAKIKKKIDEKEVSIPVIDEAIKEFENGETELFENYAEYKAKIDE